MNYGTSGFLATTGAVAATTASPWIVFSAVSIVILAGAGRFLLRQQSTRP